MNMWVCFPLFCVVSLLVDFVVSQHRITCISFLYPSVLFLNCCLVYVVVLLCCDCIPVSLLFLGITVRLGLLDLV
jgi:hypothetical protein